MHQVISFFQTCAFRHSHPLLVQADEVTPPLDTAERAADGMNLIMARLMNILDSWISFEDNVMEELDASEHAAQNVMRGIVGEVDLVDRTSAAVTRSLVDNVMPQFPNIHISSHVYTKTLHSLMEYTNLFLRVGHI